MASVFIFCAPLLSRHLCISTSQPLFISISSLFTKSNLHVTYWRLFELEITSWGFLSFGVSRCLSILWIFSPLHWIFKQIASIWRWTRHCSFETAWLDTVSSQHTCGCIETWPHIRCAPLMITCMALRFEHLSSWFQHFELGQGHSMYHDVFKWASIGFTFFASCASSWVLAVKVVGVINFMTVLSWMFSFRSSLLRYRTKSSFYKWHN